LGTGLLSARVARFRRHFDDFRSAVVNEPRGSDVMVGGLLCEPHDASCDVGVIFFNNVGYLGMCGHGTIGLVKTLEHLGRTTAGTLRIDTPVGPVDATLLDDGRVRVANVRSYRQSKDVAVNVPGYGKVTGDIAWGGNWFFLVTSSPPERLELSNARRLTEVTLQIRDALASQGITGAGEAYIDHVELFGPADRATNDSKNFVMCPGGAYDRSPCGTGTSAKLACLAADGKLPPGGIWRQESIVGSSFDCSYAIATDGHGIIPTITGSAYISGEARLILDPKDPLRAGIRA
jgi:4-hydroxyproline epimerase